MCWIRLFELIPSSAFRESAFLYAGHGSGSKYFGHENMLLLDKAPLSLLMGCSSVKMGMKGRWIRMETPLYYMILQSPATVRLRVKY